MPRLPALPPLRRRARLVVIALGVAAGAAAAQQVLLAGSLGQTKALLLIDGQPATLAVGESAHGVTLKRLGDGEAEVEIGGQSRRLVLGIVPARIGSAAPPPGTQIVIAAGPGGHFTTAGAINGHPVRFMVDTGATTMALSEAEATRIDLDWKSARRGMTQTAGGPMPVHLVNLTSVRIGEVEVANVAAVVLPTPMPLVLLGNSFLARFSMHRDADVMRLDKKP